MLVMSLTACLLGLTVVIMVQGHGRLIEPAGRSSLWRYGYAGAVANYQDNELWCGGMGNQFNAINAGQCGECGDEWSLPRPRPNDEGGVYGKNIIARTYTSGREVEFKVDLTGSHQGYFEFRLCAKRSASELVTQDCLDQNLLKTNYGTTRVNADKGSVVYSTLYKLPDGLKCDFCVLQWKYVAGNNWGICGNGTQGIGCGNQETYQNCADISIY